MSNKKLSPEEELEKQYREYKAQFEQWKEKNKGSESTTAYNDYVKRFETWEKDVERRRAQVRQKAEAEKREAEMRRAAAEREEQEKRKREEDIAAAAYAEQQKHYISMHAEAIESKVTVQRQTMPVQQPAQAPDADLNTMYSVMQQMFSFASATINADQKPNGDIPHQRQPTSQYSQQATIQAEPQPAAIQQPQQPLQLWGNEGATYGPEDQMFRKWNIRAAPANFKIPYQPPPQKTPITPCWFLIQNMTENRLMFASHRNVPPPPISNFAPRPDMSMNSAGPPPSMNTSMNIPPPAPMPNLNVPPPISGPNMNVPPQGNVPSMNVPPPTSISISMNAPPSTVPPMNIPPPTVQPIA